MIGLQDWAPYALSFGNNTSAILNGSGYSQGWLVLAYTQMGMVLYGSVTDQDGFIGQLVLVGIALRNWYIRPRQ